jgi:tetratricopeptide (TPR) repeat protein
VQTLLDELSAFAGSTFGYAKVRAYSLAADINADLKDWEAAKDAWTRAAAAASKTYLAPVSFFNAAVAAEEQGDIAGAIVLYTQCLDFADLFPAAPRAQFSIGRLLENQHDIAAAVEAYRSLVEKWPTETVWTNLANSRIAALE